MGVTPDVATGYSLLIVGATAAYGAVRYFKEGLVDVKASILFAVPSIIAVYLTRAFLMPAIPETISFQSLTIDKNLGIMVLFATGHTRRGWGLPHHTCLGTYFRYAHEKRGGRVAIHYRLKVVTWLHWRPTNRNSIGDAFAAAYAGSHVYWDGCLHEGSGKTRRCSFAEVLCIFHSSYCRFHHDQRTSLGEHP